AGLFGGGVRGRGAVVGEGAGVGEAAGGGEEAYGVRDQRRVPVVRQVEGSGHQVGGGGGGGGREVGGGGAEFRHGCGVAPAGAVAQVLGQFRRGPALGPEDGGGLPVPRAPDGLRQSGVDGLPDQVVPERQPAVVHQHACSDRFLHFRNHF